MLKELFAINNFPYLPQDPAPLFKEKVFIVLKTYGLIFLVILFVGPLIYLADNFVIHVLHFKSIRQQGEVTFQHLIKKTGYTVALIYICLIGPILEESIFRLPLSFKRVHIAVSVSVALFLFSSVLPAVQELTAKIGLGYALLVRLALVTVIFFVVVKLMPANLSVGPGYKKVFIIISICLFGLMHISNYAPLNWSIIWIYPVYVLPQLVMGWALTYVRFKNGFIWAVALHCLINSVSMLLSSGYSAPVQVQHPHVVVKAKQPKT